MLDLRVSIRPCEKDTAGQAVRWLLLPVACHPLCGHACCCYVRVLPNRIVTAPVIAGRLRSALETRHGQAV